MRKLKLDIDSLAVETFDTRSDEASSRGTLFARDESGTAHTDCWGLSCPNCGASAGAFCTQECPNGSGDFEIGGTCNNTCASCGNSCDGWHTCVYGCDSSTCTVPETCADCWSVGEVC
ncbi:MAG TPA: hypothetical protein VFQ39_13675 [Longimicrobium sp.]|nr:hypothetical protein [Longimicrobium sp.]